MTSPRTDDLVQLLPMVQEKRIDLDVGSLFSQALGLWSSSALVLLEPRAKEVAYLLCLGQLLDRGV